MKRVRVFLAAAIGAVPLALAGLFPAVVSADSSNVNFENPPYNLGVVNGQDGWTATGSAGSGCAVYDEGVAGSNGVTGFGAQSFRISNAVTSGCFGDQAFAKPLNDAVGEADSTNGTFSAGTLQRHFEMQFSIASAQPNAQQSGLAVSVSPDRGDGSRMSYLRFEDGTSGINVFFDDVQGASNPANFVEAQVASNLKRTKPHTVKLTLDTLDGPSNDVVHVWVDGNLVHTGTSWENYYRYDSESAAEQSPRIVKTVLFRAGGVAVPTTNGKGFLFDNLSTSSSALLVPTSKDQCKDDGWKQFVSPSFHNQGQCIDWVQAKATADLRLSGPSQRIKFNVANKPGNGHHDHRNTVEYWNYDYPGGLHYAADVACSYVNPQTKETRFMFQIPAGHPGLSGLYVVAYAKEVNSHHAPDLYGHAATADLATATQWCQAGTGFSPVMYTVAKGNIGVE